mmetsp:Transcript_92633/g.276258  ORF Transcript_92633/g.276258 Transcript_92633/m.276258 type:complete len:234 (-) Transcript_92633:3-704(-)
MCRSSAESKPDRSGLFLSRVPGCMVGPLLAAAIMLARCCASFSRSFAATRSPCVGANLECSGKARRASSRMTGSTSRRRLLERTSSEQSAVAAPAGDSSPSARERSRTLRFTGQYLPFFPCRTPPRADIFSMALSKSPGTDLSTSSPTPSCKAAMTSSWPTDRSTVRFRLWCSGQNTSNTSRRRAIKGPRARSSGSGSSWSCGIAYAPHAPLSESQLAEGGGQGPESGANMAL